MTSRVFTLKDMAEAGYIMGLSTIGEVANHMRSHYDAYFLIATMDTEMGTFEKMVAGHEDDVIELYITDEDKKKMDDELDKAMAEGPQPFSVVEGDATPEDPPMT